MKISWAFSWDDCVTDVLFVVRIEPSLDLLHNHYKKRVLIHCSMVQLMYAVATLPRNRMSITIREARTQSNY